MKLCRGPSVSDVCSTWHRGLQSCNSPRTTLTLRVCSQPDTDDFIVSILFSNYWDPTGGDDVSHLTNFVEKLPTSSLRKRKKRGLIKPFSNKILFWNILIICKVTKNFSWEVVTSLLITPDTHSCRFSVNQDIFLYNQLVKNTDTLLLLSSSSRLSQLLSCHS